MKIGCEGRDLLDSLSYHDQTSLNKQQRDILKLYAKSLEKWLDKGQAETAIESKAFGFLGQTTDKKVNAVEKLVHIVNSGEPSVSSFRKLNESICKENQKDTVTVTRERYRG